MLVTPEILRADKKLRGMLWSFDFEVQDPDHDAIWFDTAPLQPFEVVAAKGSGCVYALTGMQRHVLFVTSEGQAGIIAEDLNQCLELIVAYPYWQDVLRRSEGDLEALRRIFRDGLEDFEEGALDDNPEIEEFRPLLRKQLGLGKAGESAERLYHAVTVLGADVVVHTPDGYPSEPLVAAFKPR
jgi:hypothetical protein